MTQSHDEELVELFKQAEKELVDENFRTQVMFKVIRQKRKRTALQYGYWVFILLCLYSIFPAAVESFLVLGEIIGDSPFILKNFMKPYFDFPMVLILLSASVGILLNKSRLLRLPSLYLFSIINLFKLHK